MHEHIEPPIHEAQAPEPDCCPSSDMWGVPFKISISKDWDVPQGCPRGMMWDVPVSSLGMAKEPTGSVVGRPMVFSQE